MNIKELKYCSLPVDERWCVHSYYTLCPYAPDGSGRILLSGAELESGKASVFVVSENGQILSSFGDTSVTDSFWHTGLWQTWSPDAKAVYYQAGTLDKPEMVLHNLESGEQGRVVGAVEGAPPFGEPMLSGMLGMLYAAGYGTGVYDESLSPVPFQNRTEHGIFEYTINPAQRRLRLCVADVLETHPERDRLLAADREVKARLGKKDGLTLMAYCLRWNPQGTRFLFYFGNHCVVKDRGEPRLGYVFTADQQMKDIHLAVDLSFGRPGAHWGWCPDGETLIGYGYDYEDEGRVCLAQVNFDGSGYRRVSRHASGGHSSVCPANPELVVTDESSLGGRIVLIDIVKDRELAACAPGRVYGDKESAGRNPLRVCHHPVFSPDGKKILVNSLPGRLGELCEIEVPEELL